MDIRRISDTLSVSPQIEAADVPEIVRLGFKSIVCNRPDGEQEGQPLFEDIATAARSQGLEFVFQPVSSGLVTDDNARDFSSIVNGLPAPVLAYCRTGTRCTVLWALGEAAAAKPIDGIVNQAAGAGYNLSGMLDRLAAVSRE
jgi:sulfide:quinone oxidoreductase